MIEKDVIFEDSENRKASMFYIKAETPKEFFETIKQMEEQLKAIYNFDLKLKEDFIVFDLKDPNKPNTTSRDFPFNQ